MTTKIPCLVFSLAIFGALTAFAQDPNRFNAQIEALLEKEYQISENKERVVFTGSSSIVRWKDFESIFPKYNVINYGFGGSQFSDLIHFYEPLIHKPAPDILFIYEGDNDVASGKEPTSVFNQAKGLVEKIKSDLPHTRIILIAPKPCIKNWGKRKAYSELNQMLATYCKKHDMLEFADVWQAMVDEDGIVFQDIFVEDGDHMNAKGYAIWKDVISNFLN